MLRFGSVLASVRRFAGKPGQANPQFDQLIKRESRPEQSSRCA